MIFRVADPLTGLLLGTLPVTAWSLGDPVVGGGSGTITVALSALDPTAIARLRTLTTPDAVAVVADDESDSDNRYPWSGIVTARNYKRRAGTLELTLQDMRSWFYSAVLRPGAPGVDGNGDLMWIDVEQTTILRAFATAALADVGTPAIVVEALAATGVLREVTARRWKNLGEALDQVAGRANGMEWWVDTRVSSTPNTIAWTWRAMKQRTSRTTPFMVHSTPQGGNVLDYEWPEDAGARRSRVTGVGDGSPPDLPYATDQDPALASDTLLLREEVHTWAGIDDPVTLFDHAQSERMARNAPVQSVSVTILNSGAPLNGYSAGDRVRLRILDHWVDVDLAAVRIINRTISGGRGTPEQAILTLDLNDAEIPTDTSGEQVDL